MEALPHLFSRKLQTFSNTSNSVLCCSSSILSFSVSVRHSSGTFHVISKESWVKPRLRNRDIPSSLLLLCACASAAHSVYTYVHSIKNCLLLGSDATNLTVDHNSRISFAETSVMQRISSLFRHIRSSRRDLHSVPKFCKIRQNSPLRRVTSFESRRELHHCSAGNRETTCTACSMPAKAEVRRG